jgi:hypothetical protein
LIIVAIDLSPFLLAMDGSGAADLPRINTRFLG